jgi:hypothetical protein
MFVLEIVKITYSVLVFPGLKLETTSKLWKLAWKVNRNDFVFGQAQI